MSYKLLNGKWLASVVHLELKERVEKILPTLKRAPGLAVILVGDNPASHKYVAAKEKTAHQCGIETFDVRLPATATFEEVASAIQKFNEDSRVDGILLQLPLPAGLDTDSLLDLISSEKDADGLHPLNQGLLMRGEGTLRPCTPQGAMKLIDLAYSDVVAPADGVAVSIPKIPKADLAGKTAVVLGRSILVGKPALQLLLERNCTVTQAHSKSPNLKQICLSADIIVSAVGRAKLVQGDWVKKDAIVIDVGTNVQADGKLVGDVDFAAASLNARAITPVPGGVGPMTIAQLLENTVASAEKKVS